MLHFLSFFMLSLVLPLVNPLATPTRDLAVRQSGDLQKRFNNAQWTYYNVGWGSCERSNVPSDFVVALNAQQYGAGSNCFKTIRMSYGGKTAYATIVDECPGCPYGGLDLSTGLFSFFAPLPQGEIFGTWAYV